MPKPLHEVSADEAARVFLINAYFPIAAAEAFADLLKPNGTVAFMSSRLGSIALNDYGSWETYRLSKAALNMGARSFFHRHAGHAVLSIAPGWVRTDMGGPSATFDVETSCRNVANAIARHAGKPGQPLCELRRHRVAVVDRAADPRADLMPQSDPIDFYFSIGSLFTFLTVMRMDRVEDTTDIRFVWRPFRVRTIMQEMNNLPGRAAEEARLCVPRRAPARRDVRLRVRGRCRPTR